MAGSPVLDLFSGFVSVDRESARPVYLQVSGQLINAIQRGYLPAGAKLPGARALGGLLGLHRKTVIAVYAELEAQGWVDVRPNKGAFVLPHSREEKRTVFGQKRLPMAQYPAETGYSFRKSTVLDSPYEFSDLPLQFNDGQPDIRLTQMQHLSSLYSASLKRKSNIRRIRGHQPNGSPYFREQLANYLNVSSGLRISKENLLITRSVEMGLYIISQMLLARGDRVLVGDPGMFSANMVFGRLGASVQTVPVDGEGLDVSHIREHYKPGNVRMVYVTPRHHYPTTVTLSAQRRMDLLQLSAEYGFIIIEDEQEADFRYEPAAVMPLAAADADGMVVHLGSFGKSLAPAFRMGFVVAPGNLMAEMRKYLGIIDRQGDIIMEQALGEMIEEGEIHRHLKKSLKAYRDRRDFCCNMLETKFEDLVSFRKPTGGLAIWTRWPENVSLLRLARFCAADGLFIPRNLLYQNSSTAAIRLGFGHLREDEMAEALEILRRAFLLDN